MIPKKDRRDSLQGMLMQLMHEYKAVNYKRLQELGAHPGQLPFIKVISEQEGVSQGKLAEHLHVKPPTVAVTMKRLEKSELIYRKPDPDDQRVSRIYLTEKGKVVADDIIRVIDENEKALEAGFTEEELAQVCVYLRRMQENLMGLGKE